jgi:retinol-binding protein 3
MTDDPHRTRPRRAARRATPWTVYPVLSLLVASTPLLAQAPAPAGTDPEPSTRTEVVEAVLTGLERTYVFPEVAAEMGRAVRDRLRRGEYDDAPGEQAFAELLTAHLQAVSNDKHLRVRYQAEPPSAPAGGAESPAAARARREAVSRSSNYGFERVERLPGNVGYLELRGFDNPQSGSAEATVAAAMTFLSNTDALIVDLRRNGGGSPDMVALISSYLFGPEPVHLNSLYYRPDDRTDDFWTRREVAGTRYGPDRPVYVLTSSRTFSAAEEFTYNLRNLQRATVVGETTGGGAHPGGDQRINDHFRVFIPTGRAISPITGTNWEGTGVEPHVKVPREAALPTAHAAILRKLLAEETSPAWRRALEEVLQEVEESARAAGA